MNTVFPYYNELFKAATIDYSVLDNYNVTESFKRRYENIGKTAGVSSSVGKVMDMQKSENTDERETDSTRNGENVVAETTSNHGEENVQVNATDSELTTVTGNSKENGKETVTKNGDKDVQGSVMDETRNVRRFLDTPQGATNLTDNSYLTNLTDESTNKTAGTTEQTSTEETVETTFGKGVDSTTETNGEITKESETATTTDNSGSRNVTSTDTDTASEKSIGKTNGSFEGEQNTLQDSNTRTEMKHDHTEEYELIKKGNIGVDTDADMIQKHINLQKVLKQIEKMFFDECEDLFMMVY